MSNTIYMRSQTPNSESDLDNRVQYKPDGRPAGKKTMTYDRRVEPAARDAVEVQLSSVREHLDDSIKLVRAELGGQIELIRRDVNDLQGHNKQSKERGWDAWKIIINCVSYIIASGIGALIMWFLTRPKPEG